MFAWFVLFSLYNVRKSQGSFWIAWRTPSENSAKRLEKTGFGEKRNHINSNYWL